MFKYLFSHYFHYVVYCLLGWLSVLLYQVGLFKEISRVLKENKLFFFLLILVFTIIPLCNAAFNPLVYFDEHNYILSAQNIVENGIGSICTTDNNGQCQQFTIAPHGMGVAAIYAILYNYDFDVFYRKIALLNLFLYLLNSVLAFIIAGHIFSYKTISKTTSILILLMPFNIIYATAAMPATISNTFILISIYCFIHLIEFEKRPVLEKDILNNKYWISLLFALTILLTFRVEYFILFQASLFILLCSNTFMLPENNNRAEKKLFYSKGKILQMIHSGVILGIVAMVYFYVDLYRQVKTPSLDVGKFGLNYLNGNYIAHYFMNGSFWFLSILFVIHFIHLSTEVLKNGLLSKRISEVTLFCVFIVFLTLYSFYSFQSLHRYLIPITSIYALMSSATMYFQLESRIKNTRRIWSIICLFLIVLGIFFVKDGVKWKNKIIINQKNKEFIDLIQADNLNKLTHQYKEESFYFFRAPYLGQVTRTHNYLDDFPLAVKKLKAGAHLFYLESPFEQINSSPFNNPEEFIMHKENKKGLYGVYRIELRSSFNASIQTPNI